MARKKRPTPNTILAVFGKSALELRAAVDGGCSVDERDADGRTALHHAAIQGDLDIFQLLIEMGADPNASDSNGWTPLHFASQNCNCDIASLLLKLGSQVDSYNVYGNTPLSNAVFESRGKGEMIKLLLSFGADRNKTNKYGVSPLSLAKTIANYNVIQWFE